jgi:ribosomal protein S18 acetylase RimI-like enzyme
MRSPGALPDETARLRLAEPGEAASVLAILLAAFAQYRGRLVPESGTFRETVATIARRLGEESCVVAERQGRILAALFYKNMGDHCYFSRLAVVPESRGEGLARRLIEHVEAAARAARLPAVALGVRIALPDNIAFFTKLGYREVGRETHEGFSQPTSLRMEKRLVA